MKIKNKITNTLKGISFSALMITLLVVQSCSDNSAEASLLEITSQQLSARTWKVKSVTVDGKDNTAMFKDFVLKYDATTFTTTSGTLVWPASGSWKFKDNTARAIVRDDGLEVTIETISDTGFTFDLIWAKTTFGPGRTSALSGIHKFEMVH
ncbi:MAG: hypothetical protein WDN75_07850 [Bacteroidota bacterium]